jgi:hypothetical protein
MLENTSSVHLGVLKTPHLRLASVSTLVGGVEDKDAKYS